MALAMELASRPPLKQLRYREHFRPYQVVAISMARHYRQKFQSGAAESKGLLGGIEGTCAPFPVRIGVEVHGVLGWSALLAGELDSQPVHFDQGNVLDQATEGHRAGGSGRPQALLVEARRLPGEGPPVWLEHRLQRLGLGGNG